VSARPLLDQAAHVTAVAIALTPAALLPNPLTFAWAGFCMGLTREVTEEGPPVTAASVIAALRSWQDLAFWTLAGFLVGLIPAVAR